MPSVKFLTFSLLVLALLNGVASLSSAGPTDPNTTAVLEAFRKPEPTTAAEAAQRFEARAAAAITLTACSREGDYLHFRDDMANGKYDDEGENLTSILIAKAAFVRSHVDEPCHGTMPKSESFLHNAGPSICLYEADDTLFSQNPDFYYFHLSRACLVSQINEAILAMRKTSVMGTTDIPCQTNLDNTYNFVGKNHPGEFDVVVRELVRLLYFAGPRVRDSGLLLPTTIDYMYRVLLAARGAVGPESYSTLTDCAEPAGDELGTPEDTADRHAWYRDLGDDIGDALEWLFKLWVRTSVANEYVHSLVDTGGLSEIPFLLKPELQRAVSPFSDIRVPETENHRLMIETSRYLTNADIIARLEAEDYDHVQDVRDDQQGVHDWLLQRLQDIAAHDFREYNARPYTRYSLNAIVNLYDFASIRGDETLAKAALIVLDLSEAKFAATSNRGRRTSPFRRLSDLDGYDLASPKTAGAIDLYNIVQGGDHEVARAMMMSGQTQLLPNGPSMDALQILVNAAVSGYRLPTPVLSTAVERPVMIPFLQTVKHAGVERVFQSPAFTISAGGVPTEATASVLGKSKPDDYGVAMPTTIIPTLSGSKITDLFRFEGSGEQNERSSNTCVAQDFACGVSPQLPELFAACTNHIDTSASAESIMVTSAVCFPESDAGPHFYLAGRFVECSGTFCSLGRKWGVIEIVEASPPRGGDGRPAITDPAFETFWRERSSSLRSLTVDDRGDGSYVTAAGQRIDFNVSESGPQIRAINGAPAQAWSTASSANAGFDADGQGRATIKGPGGPIVVDFTDWQNPKRTP